MPEKRYILNQHQAAQKIHRMTLELAENLSGNDAPVVLIGIRNSGTTVAEKLGKLLQQYITNSMQIVSMQLDKDHPTDVVLSEQVELNGKNIVIIDDVSNSGRTLVYALKPILEGHPKSIQTMVLVERMHQLFPVKPDYVGLSLATTKEDHIQVEVVNGEIVGAYVI
ncbi:MAG: phosphoribosyltransferase [Sphingobacteriia bacterium]|nr:MAG: phosphoribosyltransferase [Sphingobacteriia bacterium]